MSRETVHIKNFNEYKYSQLEEQKDIQALFDDLKTKNEAFLIQGAPTSPALANMVCYRMDRRIIGWYGAGRCDGCKI